MWESFLETSLTVALLMALWGWTGFWCQWRSRRYWQRRAKRHREELAEREEELAETNAAGAEILKLLDELYAELDSGRERLERAQALLGGKEV